MGTAGFEVGGTKHRTPAGSIFVVPPEVVHSNNVFAEGCDFRSMLIDADVFGGIARSAGLKLRRQIISKAPAMCSPAVTRRFDYFHRQLESGVPRLDLEGELEQWVSGLLGHQTGQDPHPRRTEVHPSARRARECLWARATENVSQSELAREVGLSRFELSRVFKAAYGMPPHAWQLQVRVQRAKEMLKVGTSAGETAIRAGFADQAHLCRVFKKATGCTPARYGAQFRKIVQDRVTESAESRG